MEIVQLDGNEGVVESSGVRRAVRLDLLEDVKVGDYVLIHAGYAIQKLDAQEAQITLDLIAQMVESEE